MNGNCARVLILQAFVILIATLSITKNLSIDNKAMASHYTTPCLYSNRKRKITELSAPKNVKKRRKNAQTMERSTKRRTKSSTTSNTSHRLCPSSRHRNSKTSALQIDLMEFEIKYSDVEVEELDLPNELIEVKKKTIDHLTVTDQHTADRDTHQPKQLDQQSTVSQLHLPTTTKQLGQPSTARQRDQPSCAEQFDPPSSAKQLDPPSTTKRLDPQSTAKQFDLPSSAKQLDSLSIGKEHVQGTDPKQREKQATAKQHDMEKCIEQLHEVKKEANDGTSSETDKISISTTYNATADIPMSELLKPGNINSKIAKIDNDNVIIIVSTVGVTNTVKKSEPRAMSYLEIILGEKMRKIQQSVKVQSTLSTQNPKQVCCREPTTFLIDGSKERYTFMTYLASKEDLVDLHEDNISMNFEITMAPVETKEN